MFGIGFPELLLILALALIVVGPDKLPDLARSIAKTLVDLKKTAEGLKDSIDIDDNPINEIKPKLEDAAKNFKESILDADKPTWNVPEDLEELARADTDPPQEGEEEWQRPTDQPAGEKGKAESGSSEDDAYEQTPPGAESSGPESSPDADHSRDDPAAPPAGENR